MKTPEDPNQPRPSSDEPPGRPSGPDEPPSTSRWDDDLPDDYLGSGAPGARSEPDEPDLPIEPLPPVVPHPDEPPTEGEPTPKRLHPPGREPGEEPPVPPSPDLPTSPEVPEPTEVSDGGEADAERTVAFGTPARPRPEAQPYQGPGGTPPYPGWEGAQGHEQGPPAPSAPSRYDPAPGVPGRPGEPAVPGTTPSSPYGGPPGGGPPGYAQPGGYGPGPYGYQPSGPGSGLATASLVLGVASPFLVFVCFTGLLTAILSIVFGTVALTKGVGKGRAITGIVLSVLALILFTVVAVWFYSVVQECAQLPGELADQCFRNKFPWMTPPS
ncbi:DUF4190 domain-containing protein [Nonomuraea cavernae]|uniref:DUF4190 domain-containing protein n=1 Tax=Nonomuraea cavernae TaxID=2045107 RepID=UPI0033E821D4